MGVSGWEGACLERELEDSLPSVWSEKKDFSAGLVCGLSKFFFTFPRWTF